jgi:tetratricopeptide (TPR) repeat protein
MTNNPLVNAISGFGSISNRAFLFSFIVLLIILQLLWNQAAAQDDTRLSATWKVKNYEINAVADEAGRSIDYKAKISLQNVSGRPASTLTLRITPLAEVKTAFIQNNQADFTKREEKIGSGSLQQILLRPGVVAPAGEIIVELDYKISLKDNSGLSAISAIEAQFLPLSFWYPTPNSWFFSRGSDYAPYKLKVSGLKGKVTLSSGVMTVPDSFDNQLNCQPFFVAGDFDVFNQSNVEIYIPKGMGEAAKARAAELAKAAQSALQFMSSRFGAAPPVPVRIIGVRRAAGFASCGTILIDQGLFSRPKIDSLAFSQLAEGIAKIWTSGSVFVSGDGFGVIRDGLARLLANEFTEQQFGASVADVERLRQRTAYAAIIQRESAITTASPLDDSYFAVTANKGAIIWRLLRRRIGAEVFDQRIRSAFSDGSVTLAEIRSLFDDQKPLLDALFDQPTDTNLMVGLPQSGAGEIKVALRNTGSIEAAVNVAATLQSGKKMSIQVMLQPKSFGEATFVTNEKAIKVEIDPEKIYPQTDYSDDVAPREFSESDPVLAIKRRFDRQEFAEANKVSATALNDWPELDDARILRARALLALGNLNEAEKEFQTVLEQKLPLARSIAWATEGLAEIEEKRNQPQKAQVLADQVIRYDADAGASIAARNLKLRIKGDAKPPAEIAQFFEAFDRAAMANQKSQLEAMAVSGEASRFISGVAGQTVEWKTEPMLVDFVTERMAIVEAKLSVKILNRDPESGTATFRLVKVGNQWRLLSVDSFNVP